MFITEELRNNVDELDANGRLVVDSQAITISARKIHNLYHGHTHPNVYEMEPEELQVCMHARVCVCACARQCGHVHARACA